VCTHNPKKKVKKVHSAATPKKEEKKKEGSKSDVYFSLSSERVLFVCAAHRARLLWSLFCSSAFCSSHQNNAFKERAPKKDKNILVHVM
jgi:hypothetical protein